MNGDASEWLNLSYSTEAERSQVEHTRHRSNDDKDESRSIVSAIFFAR
jgi:hypothetical protein